MRVLYITLFIVVIDQITKFLIKGFSLPIFDYYHQGMILGQSIPVIGDFLRITFIENPGMVFGIDIGGQLLRAIFTILACLAILYYIYHIKNEALIVRITLAMILGGAIGNMIDRTFYGVIYGEAPLFYGKVVDFVDVDIIDINIFGIHMERFAIFNVADSAVTIGIILMILFHNKFTKKEEAKDITNDAEKIVAEQNPITSESVEEKSEAEKKETGS